MEPTFVLRNLADNLHAVLVKLRDGESRPCENFNPQDFWEKLEQTFKATSQEATKMSLAFSKAPLPSGEDSQKLSDGLVNAVLAAATVYCSLPKTQGTTLRKAVRESVAEIIEGIIQLVEGILRSLLQSQPQAQLVSTGNVWEACDQWPQIPKENRAAVIVLVSGYLAVVKDAVEEVEQAMADGEDPFHDVLEDDVTGIRGNQDTYWSEADRQLLTPCVGLMKASKACLKKVLGALKAHGNVDSVENVAQLDDIAEITQEISPSVDELALSMYPPMNHTAVRYNAAKLSSVLKKVLEIIRTSHVCPDSESPWVQFLNGAIDHNLDKIKSLTQNAQ
ncbi:cyclin-D1-binding protein 1 [Bombina bombina]|uniref:cyclin-D1-binding protein 1 n=1 Tax=Bombina bombina TaxID=8345 RepID=UPI00235A5FF9|nr:cyclin-D1-binding protein 1 [Bombina bombina]